MNTDIIQGTPPPPAQSPQAPEDTWCIIFKLEIPGLIAHGAGADFFSPLLCKSLVSALRANGIQCQEAPAHVGADCAKEKMNITSMFLASIGVCVVNDLKRGLVTLRDEFTAMQAGQYVEIGWMDHREGIWRLWHPTGCNKPFNGFAETVAQWRRALDQTPKPTNQAASCKPPA